MVTATPTKATKGRTSTRSPEDLPSAEHDPLNTTKSLFGGEHFSMNTYFMNCLQLKLPLFPLVSVFFLPLRVPIFLFFPYLFSFKFYFFSLCPYLLFLYLCLLPDDCYPCCGGVRVCVFVCAGCSKLVCLERVGGARV